MNKGCKHIYKGVTYDNYQQLKEALIEEQSSFYFAPFLAAVEDKLAQDPNMSTSEIKRISDELAKEYMLGEDISITLSQLLSAATDNAKELILSKINAGPETAGVYAYLTMLGVPFKDISELMVSPEVNWVINKSKKNIYDSKTDFNTLERSITELKEGPNSIQYMDIGRVYILGDIIRENLKNPKFLNALSYSSKFKDPEVIKALLNSNKKAGPVIQLTSPFGINFIKDKKTGNITSTGLNISKSDMKDFFDTLMKDTFIPETHVSSASSSQSDEFEDMDSYEDDENYGSSALPVKIEISRYLEEVLDYLNTAPDLGNIEEFESILKDSKETVILGKMLSVNQGIKTDAYSQYSFIRSVSDFIITRTNEKWTEGVPQSFIDSLESELTEKGISTIYLQSIIDNFDFSKFLGIGLTPEETSTYQESSKLYYNKIKSAFNILAIVTETPHFKAMLSVAGLMEDIKGSLSVKYNLVNQIIDELYEQDFIQSDFKGKALSEKDFYKVMDFANDTIILKWLRSLPDPDRQFTYSTNVNYQSIGKEIIRTQETNKDGSPKEATPHTIDIGKAEDRLGFIDMIHEMILVLKEGKTMANGKLVESSLLKKNAFVHAFDMDKKKDPITGKNNKFYKLPINVLSVAESSTHKFNEYLIGFADLAKVTYNGYPIKDLLFLYNTFIHRDKINRDSLTKLFESSVSGIEGTLMGEFIKWGGELDWNNQTLKSLREHKDYDYAIEDIIIKGLASKIFSKDLSRFKGKYAYSMVFNPATGTMDKQYYTWSPESLSMPTGAGTYIQYTHFTKDMAIALSAGSEMGVQRASENDYTQLLTEVNRRGIYPINIQINCD